ncbi:MAG: long-chain fatty acid--CoA ligase [Polyangiaceae bacterium]
MTNGTGRTLHGTMMATELTLDVLVRRAATEFGHVEVVSRRPDKSLHRTNYADVCARATKLAKALVKEGVTKGTAVATLMWNHAFHLEAYFGVPLSGAVLHTLNLRLHPTEIAWIAKDAGDRIVFVDEVLLPLFDKVLEAGATFAKVVVVNATRDPGPGRTDYETFLAGADDATNLPVLHEGDALGCCYTSGTTGQPKGVVYTHRSTLLHSIVSALPDSLDLSRRDTLLPVVPMFHVNAWGLPYSAALVGAKQVHPGPMLDAGSLLDLMQREKVTCAAGVPTLWIGIRELMDGSPPGTFTLEPGLRMVVGGSAAPEQLIRDFDRLGMRLLHAWGMTETSPIGLVSKLPPETDAETEDQKYRMRAKQGVPPPFVEVRVRNDRGVVPRDAKTAGELEVRGPWIAAAYANLGTTEKWTDDGFFRTGDVANVCPRGMVQLTDRVADLIKSGGEWIASQEIENALMGHPAVKEAAVIGVAHPKWSERPLAAIVWKPGQTATDDELRAFLAPKFAKFWIPDAFVVLETIPRTSAGKFKKTELRDQFKTWAW